jgi:hypothetical protein
MEAKFMTTRCDYCRGKFGLIVHRYWQMRFCSAVCTQAYQQRLHDETKGKIGGLNGAVLDECATRPMSHDPEDIDQQFAA